VHNDVNKIIWTALAWDRKADERNILKEYSNYFFGSAFAEEQQTAFWHWKKTGRQLAD